MAFPTDMLQPRPVVLSPRSNYPAFVRAAGDDGDDDDAASPFRSHKLSTNRAL